MELKLNEQDLQVLDKQLQEMPFKHAYPLFQFLRTKIAEQSKNPDDADVQVIE